MSQLARKKAQTARQEIDGLEDCGEELIYHIICLRKQIDVQEHWRGFREVLDDHLDYLTLNLSNRWLNSIVDTYIDHTDNEVVRLQATILSEYFCAMHVIWRMQAPEKKTGLHVDCRHNYDNKLPIMFSRIDKVITLEPFISIWRRLRVDLNTGQSTWDRILKVRKQPHYYWTGIRLCFAEMLNEHGIDTALLAGGFSQPFYNVLRDNSQLETVYVMSNESEFKEQPPTKIQSLDEIKNGSIGFAYIQNFKNAGLQPKDLMPKMANRSIIAGSDYTPERHFQRSQVDSLVKGQRPTFLEHQPQDWYYIISCQEF